MTPPTDQESPATWRARFIAAAYLAGALALLGTAAWLDPSASGVGTHKQLGLQACSWLSDKGYACPTCGMTTSFALASRGQLLEAAAVQPAGATMALALAMGAWLAGWSLVTGRSLEPMVRPLWRWRTAIVALAIVLGGWAFKLMV
jgi:ferric-dicitrate binding protein FerR (iron transport regulator)